MTIPNSARLVLALLCILIGSQKSVAADTVLYVNSDPDDFIGRGNERTETPDQKQFIVSGDSRNIEVRIGPEQSDSWHLYFSAPTDSSLSLGTFNHASLWRSTLNPDPGLKVTYFQRAGTRATGWFEILDLGVSASGVPERLAIDFEQHCNGEIPLLYGSLRYNSVIPISPRPQRVEIASTQFNEAAVGSGSYAPPPGAMEIGFTTTATPHGIDALAAVQVLSNTGEPNPVLSHRSTHATTIFDFVDLRAFRDVKVSVDIGTSNASWGDEDRVDVQVTNGNESIPLLVHHGRTQFPSINDPIEFDEGFTLLHTTRIPAHWQSAQVVALSITDSGNERFDFDRVMFEGVPIPEPGSLTLALMLCLLPFILNRKVP